MTVSGPGVRVGMRGCPVIVSNYDEISVFLMGALSCCLVQVAVMEVVSWVS